MAQGYQKASQDILEASNGEYARAALSLQNTSKAKFGRIDLQAVVLDLDQARIFTHTGDKVLHRRKVLACSLAHDLEVEVNFIHQPLGFA
jgi:hypothetical protein